MKIIGLGVDIVENKRIKKSIKNKQFISRIFSKKEINQSIKFIDKTNYFSKRFAAKESLSKAIGTGFRKGLKIQTNTEIVLLPIKNGCYKDLLLQKFLKNFYITNMLVRSVFHLKVATP